MVADQDVASPEPADRETCFIIMPFGSYFDMRYESVYKPAVKAAGLKHLRGDSIFTPSPIMADVWSSIQNSGPLLADLTFQNPNVFYELGLAHALGKPVVLVSQMIDDVPFDLRPYRVITFDTNRPGWDDKLRDNIMISLKETAKQSTGAVPEMFRKIVPSQAPEQDRISAQLDQIEGLLLRALMIPGTIGVSEDFWTRVFDTKDGTSQNHMIGPLDKYQVDYWVDTAVNDDDPKETN